MAYDPNKPANNAPLVAAEMRSQFGGLKTEIDAKVNTADLVPAIQAESAGSIAGMDYLSLAVSDPPTQGEVQTIADKIDALIALLRRQ